jgi:serine/threonine protein kinase
MHQLHLIIDTLGSPSVEDSNYIASDKAKTYIRSLPHRARVDFKQLLPQVTNMNALDLLSKMLHFAPEQRISVQQALEHPYLAQLHDPQDEPECQSLVDFDLEDEQRVSTQHQQLPQLTPQQQKEQLKQLLWTEVCILHPELKGQEHQAKGSASSSLSAAASNSAMNGNTAMQQ